MILTTGKIDKDIEFCALHSQNKRFGETRIDKIFALVVHHIQYTVT